MDIGTRALGIVSALLLVGTLCWQLRAQWKKGSSEGVSRFLFFGQLGASTGFAIYSARIGDGVFVATNIAAGLAAIVGVVLTLLLRRRAGRTGTQPRDEAAGGHARSIDTQHERTGPTSAHVACTSPEL
jgi:MtN3 and saliva related transmembrane protein